jgi:DNA-binding response OmpR family regulator
MQSTSKGKVLVSGSHRETRYMMRVLLEMWGYDVTEAEGELETVATAETFSPDVILLDTSRLFNEEMKIVSRLKLWTHDRVPIIVLSGFTQPSYRMTAIDHGASGLLPKPIDFGLLESFLETALPA